MVQVLVAQPGGLYRLAMKSSPETMTVGQSFGKVLESIASGAGKPFPSPLTPLLISAISPDRQQGALPLSPPSPKVAFREPFPLL